MSDSFNDAYAIIIKGAKEKRIVLKDVGKAVKGIDELLNKLGGDYCPYEELEEIRDMLEQHLL